MTVAPGHSSFSAVHVRLSVPGTGGEGGPNTRLPDGSHMYARATAPQHPLAPCFGSVHVRRWHCAWETVAVICTLEYTCMYTLILTEKNITPTHTLTHTHTPYHGPSDTLPWSWDIPPRSYTEYCTLYPTQQAAMYDVLQTLLVPLYPIPNPCMAIHMYTCIHTSIPHTDIQTRHCFSCNQVHHRPVPGSTSHTHTTYKLASPGLV